MDHPECGWDHEPGLFSQGVRGDIQHVPGYFLQNMFYTSFGLVFKEMMNLIIELLNSIHSNGYYTQNGLENW